MSRRKHSRHDGATQPDPDPEVDAGALWNEPAEAPAAAGAADAPAAAADALPIAEPPTEGAPEAVGLEAEVLRLQGQAAEYLDGWQRSRADFANYKKRIEREQEESRARVVADVMQDFVAILDDLERALADRPAEGEAGSWASGIELIYRKLMAVLEAEGVRPIMPAEAEGFDPNIHEAVSHEESPHHTAGQIIGVIHQGYRIGERIIRPALVRVAK